MALAAARAPGAGRIGPRAGGVGAPVLQDGLDPAPGLLLLVAAHEQVEAVVDHVQQQALVGAHALGAEALVEVEVEVNGRQRLERVPRVIAVVLPLRQQVQLEPVLRLQVDHQLVGRAIGRAEDRVRRRQEVHHDARVARCQPLAGADVERHAGPAPVGDLGPQGDEGFRRAAAD